MMLGMDTFRERLIWAREAAGLSQRKLAKWAGLASSHVQFLETPPEEGKKAAGASAETARRLAGALSLSAAWLLLGDGVAPDAESIRAAAAARDATDAARTPPEAA